MAEKSPIHGLTRGTRGWYKRVNKRPKFIVSEKLCPTGQAADDYYTQHFAALWARPKPAAPANPRSISVGDLFDAFVDAKRRKRAAGDMEPATLAQLASILQEFLDVVGDKQISELTTDDFTAAGEAWSKLAPRSRRRQIIAVRGAFKWANKAPLNLPLPAYGDSFTPPGNRELRRHATKKRAQEGAMTFTPAEIRKQLEGITVLRSNGRKLPIRPNPALRAMILLGINCGFGNSDCASLPKAAIDLDGGWVEYPRQKTGAERKAKLWPETIEAVRAFLRVRPRPKVKAHAGLVFLTREGQPYLQLIEHREDYVERRDEIAELYRRLLKRMGLWRDGRSFYSLRRTYRTLAAETGEELAIDLTMGHIGDASDMAKIYTHAILDEKLDRIAAHVRGRIFTA